MFGLGKSDKDGVVLIDIEQWQYFGGGWGLNPEHAKHTLSSSSNNNHVNAHWPYTLHQIIC